MGGGAYLVVPFTLAVTLRGERQRRVRAPQHPWAGRGGGGLWGEGASVKGSVGPARQTLGPRVSRAAPSSPRPHLEQHHPRPGTELLPCDPLRPPPTCWSPGGKSLVSWAAGTGHTPHASRGPRVGVGARGRDRGCPLGKDTGAWPGLKGRQGGRGASGPGPLGQTRGSGQAVATAPPAGEPPQTGHKPRHVSARLL